MKIYKAHRLKLYPSVAQRQAMARHAGACRWLWNYMLALQKETYERDGKFVFSHDMSKMLPGLKKQHPWLADAPSNSLVQVCIFLDRALKDSFRNGKGFPKFKARGKSKDSFYVINQALKIEASRAKLPKLGTIRFRSGRLPEGRIVSGNVSRTADHWWLTVQCEVDISGATVEPKRLTVVGVDLGLKDLMIRSDAEVVKAPKSLSKAMKRLRRAQRILSRRQKGSANRARQARRVARIHARIADQRRNVQHQATSALVKSASAIVTETPNIRGMIKNRNLSRSFADAGWGEVLRQIAYKAEWAGKMHVKADRFEPSTQTCCCCGHRRTGDGKLKLAQRIYRCAECDLEIDRDLNAAMNLRRIGLKTLFVGQPIIVETVGRVPPERGASPLRTPVESPLPGSGHLSRSGMTSPKQEVQPSNLG